MTREPRFALLAVLLAVPLFLTDATADEAAIAHFEKHIRPVLVKHCYRCHSSAAAAQGKLKGQLQLDSRAGIRSGGESGPAVVPGKVEDSLLIAALRQDGFNMPPQGKLPEAVIDHFVTWIQSGAVDPREGSPVNVKEQVDIDAAREFWAFQPLIHPPVPPVTAAAWPSTAIDQFVLAAWEEHGIGPVVDAERAVLIRRLSFDLLGLPPTAAETEAFLADRSSNAWPRLVDRLLESPHFGERWGRHWMDVVRYADSVGGGANLVYDNAWRYRDYIIRAFNDDKPFDRFVMEQIAGDLLPAENMAERRDQLIATGMLAIGAKELAEYDKEKLRMDIVDEQIDTIGKSLMGLTLGCARCHDHKFDPISTRDYYALAGIFRSVNTLSSKRFGGGGPLSQGLEVALPGSDKAHAAGVEERAKPADCPLFIRGNKDNPGSPVPRGYPAVIRVQHVPQISKSQSGRLELAEWLTQPDHPLTARVYVNRVWHHLMGAGLVRTTDNFGTRGELPANPDLLDYLASTFVAEGWSTKRLIRRIVLSRVYRLSSVEAEPQTDLLAKVAGPRQSGADVDPENRLFWRRHRRRLDAESLRDALLAASGQLDRKQMGNTLTYTGRLGTEGKENEVDRDPRFRRSVYLPRYREAHENDLMKVFDVAHPALVTGHRDTTNVPTQALYLMNSPLVVDQSRLIAAAVLTAASDDQARLAEAYRRILGRAPTESEASGDLQLVRGVIESLAAAEVPSPSSKKQAAWSPEVRAWCCLCQTLLTCNEFLFVD